MTNEMTYKGFSITPRYSAEDGKFYADVLFTTGRGYVSGATVEELEKQFHETIDFMAKRRPNAKPRKPSLRDRAADLLRSA